MTTDDPTLFVPVLEALQRSLEPKPIDRRQLLNSMQRMDYEMRLRHYPAVFDDEQRDAAEFFAAEQSPSESWFGR